MTLVNYYEVLEVQQSADAETIAKAVREKRRQWRNRQAHPKAETRALAEKITQYVSEAEEILLDAAKRADYDRRLAAQVTPPERPEPAGAGGSGRNWVEIAAQYLAEGKPSQANYAAREATSQDAENPEAWYVRAVSSHLMQNLADAEFELSEAIRLSPNNPVYHCELGDVYSSAEQWSRAQQAYQRASDLDPSDLYYQVGVAAMLTAQDQPDAALPILEKAVEQEPDVELFRFHLAVALADSMTGKWSQYPDGTRSILNEAQLELSKTTLQRIAALQVTDPELVEHIDEISRWVRRAERVTWYGSDNLGIYAGGMVVSLIGLFFLGNPSTVLIGLAGLTGIILIPALFTTRHHVPGWRWDQRRSPEFVRKSGLQPTTPRP